MAAALHMTFIDTDSEIEKMEKTSIAEIFEKKGEKYFRDLETAYLDKISGANGRIISTGGGMVLKDENVDKLRALGPLVLLRSSPEVIEKRLAATRNRPLLNVSDKAARIKQILSERDRRYNDIADLVVDTSDISPREAAEKIIEFYKGEK